MGIGYGDGFPDNERFGMRKFLYYDRTGASWGNDPTNATHFYRYLQGIWKDGTQFLYGGNAHFSDAAADPNLPCDFMFPGDSDPQGFGTNCAQNLFDWSEATNQNAKGDRRFMQSAGPFTLEPGAVNNITVGIVYARASGGLFASVEAVRLADDKAQALFDNCFQIVEGPDAPDVTIQEMDKEIVLYLSNTQGQSNNYRATPEDYEVEDPFIITPDSIKQLGITYDNKYRFEGYQIFQLKNENVSASELNDEDKARLVAQCDIKNGVGQLINWTLNEAIGVPEPEELVFGADEGIKHSFRFTEDEFALSDRNLVNHKKYYFMAIAYGYNNFKTYDVTDPLSLDGQQKPYLASRKNGQGGEIKVFTAIPHIQSPEADGTVNQAVYGEGPEITRIEGQGNGGLVLDITPASEAEILADGYAEEITYQKSRGPVNIKVVDPLNVKSGDYRLWLIKTGNTVNTSSTALNEARWILINTTLGDTISSDKSIAVGNEQLILDWGISVEIEQIVYETVGSQNRVELLEATIEYEDSSKQWLSGVQDADGLNNQNWIRSGTSDETSTPDPNTGCDPAWYNDYLGLDDNETYENVLGGVWSPYFLAGVTRLGTNSSPCIINMPVATSAIGTVGLTGQSKFDKLNSVDIVFTSDKSKWTRCPVIEMQDDPNLSEGNAPKMSLRRAPSVDKQGRSVGEAQYNASEGDLTATTGMGWFPGYALDLETGERLNMAFSEDSWLANDNGRDMEWNPTGNLYSNLGDAIFGGKHYVYVFRSDIDIQASRMPPYDEGAYAETRLASSSLTQVFRSCTWVGMPMVDPSSSLLATDARLRFRVSKAYSQFPINGNYSDSTTVAENLWNPLYEFSTDNISTITQNTDSACSALDLINIVPNPYYAYSQYEENRIDNRVKFTNLPERCTVTIFTSSGTMVRQFVKDDPLTSFDWDLKNFKGIPIASGTYIIHVKAENLVDLCGDGKFTHERVIKWFGALRPPDLDNF